MVKVLRPNPPPGQLYWITVEIGPSLTIELVQRGVIGRDESVVVCVTGNGYKTVEALEGAIEPSYRIAPDLDEFLAAITV